MFTRKFTLFGCVCTILLLAACSKEPVDPKVLACQEAGAGKLKTDSFDASDLAYNSKIASCALSGGDKAKSGTDLEARKEIVEFLNEKGLDLSFRDENGKTLLMLVVTSEFDEEWKLTLADSMMMSGADIHAKDNSGKPLMGMLDYSKQKNLKSLILHYLEEG